MSYYHCEYHIIKFLCVPMTDEVKDAIDAFERNLRHPVLKNQEDDQSDDSDLDRSSTSSSDVMRLRGGGPGRKRGPLATRADSLQTSKRPRASCSYSSESSDESSSEEESGYESSSAYGESESNQDEDDDEDDSCDEDDRSDEIRSSSSGVSDHGRRTNGSRKLNGGRRETRVEADESDDDVIEVKPVTIPGNADEPSAAVVDITDTGPPENSSVMDQDEEDNDDELSDDPKNLFNIRAKFMKLAQALKLPGNPLDTLIDQLGMSTTIMLYDKYAALCVIVSISLNSFIIYNLFQGECLRWLSLLVARVAWYVS